MPFDTTTTNFQVDPYAQYLLYYLYKNKQLPSSPPPESHQHTHEHVDQDDDTHISTNRPPFDIHPLIDKPVYGIILITNWNWCNKNESAKHAYQRLLSFITTLNQQDHTHNPQTHQIQPSDSGIQLLDHLPSPMLHTYTPLLPSTSYSTHITISTLHKFTTSSVTQQYDRVKQTNALKRLIQYETQGQSTRDSSSECDNPMTSVPFSLPACIIEQRETLLHTVIQHITSIMYQWCDRVHEHRYSQDGATHHHDSNYTDRKSSRYMNYTNIDGKDLPLTIDLPIKPFNLYINEIHLLNNALIGVCSDTPPSEGKKDNDDDHHIIDTNHHTMQHINALRSLIRDSSDSTEEYKSIYHTNLQIPTILHTTLARFVTLPLDSQGYREKLNEYSQTQWQPVCLTVDHIDVVVENTPYMHHLAPHENAAVVRYRFSGQNRTK